MININDLIKHEIPTYAELVNRRDIPDKTLVLVNDSLDDPENKDKVKKGIYVFCFDCQEWCRVSNVPEVTLDEEYQTILKDYFKPGLEPRFISQLLHLKNKIYEQAPRAEIEYRPWIESITAKWLEYADAIAKEQKEDPMDLNVGFRMQICLIFCMVLKTARADEDFTQELMFHLACQLTK